MLFVLSEFFFEVTHSIIIIIIDDDVRLNERHDGCRGGG